MASLGELFIEFGVAGDIEPLVKLDKKIKESMALIDQQIQQSKRLQKYKKDLANATSEEEKSAIKNIFVKEVEKDKLKEQLNANKKVIDSKKEFAQKVASLSKKFTMITGAIALVVAGMNKLSDSLTSNNQTWLNLTRTSDISLQTFQKWGTIGGIVNKSLGPQGAAGAIEQLNKRLFELRLTGAGARGFQLAGINPMGADAEDILEQLRVRIQGMNDTTASYLLEQMGINPQMLSVLRLSREEFEALNKEITRYQLSEAQRASIDKMNRQLAITSQKMQYFKDKAVLALIPVWIKFVNSFARVTEELYKLGASFENVTVQLADLIKKSEFLKALFPWIAAGIGLIMAALFPLQALLAALFLIIDDVMTYKQGGSSVWGEIVKWWEELKEQFSNFKLPEFKTPKWIEKIIEAAQAVKKISELKPPEDTLPKENKKNLSYNPNFNLQPFLLPSPNESVVNNYTNYNNDNKQFNQNVKIDTNQPVESLKDQFIAANFALV